MPRSTTWTFNGSSALATGLAFGNFGGGYGTGTYADDTAGTNDGTLHGFTGTGDTPTDKWAFDSDLGRRVLTFGPSDDWVQVPEAACDVTGSISFGCWFKASGTANYQCLLSKCPNGDVHQFGVYTVIGSTTQLYLALAGVADGGEGGAIFTMTSPWVVDAWNHLLVTYNAGTGALHVYLNGTSVLTVTSSGSVAHRTCDLSIGCQLGTGTSYPLQGSIADPVVYSRALSAPEVAALADIDNFALNYSGADLLTGGAGGSTGTVTPSRFYISESGQTLVLSLGTAADAPGVNAAPAADPVLTVEGSPATLGNPFYSTFAENGEFYMPHVWWPIVTPVVQPGDTVTVSLADAAVPTSAGSTIALASAAVTNLAGTGVLPDAAPASPDMVVGMNTFPGTYYQPTQTTAGWLPRSSGWIGGGDPAIAFDSAGFPTTPGTYQTIIAQPQTSDPLPRDYPMITPGTWTVVYRGNSTIRLDRNSVTLTPASTSTVGSDKLITYTVASGTTRLDLFFTRTSGQTLTKLDLYDPHVPDPLNPPRFHPRFLAQMANVRCVRSMPHLITNGSTAVNVADYASQGDVIFGGRKTRALIPVAHWEPYGTAAYNRAGLNYVKITTSSPHGLKHGHGVNIVTDNTGTTGKWDEAYAAPLQGGGTASITLAGVPVMVLSSTTFVLYLYYGAIDTTAISEHDAPAGQYVFVPFTPCPLDEPAALAALLPDCAYWHNVSHGSDDTSVAAQADLIVATLPADRDVYLEYTNEQPWNHAPGFSQNGYLKAVAGEVAGWSEATAYMTRAAQIRAIFRARWSNAGRDPNKVKLALSFQAGSSGRTSIITEFCSTHDSTGKISTDVGYAGPIAFDAAAFAFYLGITPVTTATNTQGDYESLTVEQVMDAGDAYLEHMRLPFMDTTKTLLAASDYAGVEMVAYEGGPAVVGLGPANVDSAYLRTVCWTFHPRARKQFLAFLKYWDDFGITLFNKYLSHDKYTLETGYWRCYGTYTGIDQTAGVGTANVSAMTDPDTGLPRSFSLGGARQSPVAEAVDQWNLAAAPTPDTQPVHRRGLSLRTSYRTRRNPLSTR